MCVGLKTEIDEKSPCSPPNLVVWSLVLFEGVLVLLLDRASLHHGPHLVVLVLQVKLVPEIIQVQAKALIFTLYKKKLNKTIFILISGFLILQLIIDQMWTN